MADTDPGDEDLAQRLSGVMGTGDPANRRPVSLTEALYSRIVEVTREEVSQTTEVLGEVIVQLGRLDRRIGTLADQLEAAPGTAEAPDLAAVQDRLGRVEQLLEHLASRVDTAQPAVEPPPAVDLTPLHARLDDLAETLQLAAMRIDELA